MKLSVSVPDHLYRAACAKVGSDSPSEVVQAALQSLVPDVPSLDEIIEAGMKALGLAN